MSETTYPPTVRLKKLALVLVLIGACFIAAVIFYNLSVATNASHVHGQKSENTVQTVANASDITWYQDEKVTDEKTTITKTC